MTLKASTVNPHHVAIVGSMYVVAGLFWQSLNEGEAKGAQLESLASSLNFDAAVVFQHEGGLQAGFIATEALEPGIPLTSTVALVPALVQAVQRAGVLYEGRVQSPPSWLGAFSAGNGRWVYVAVREYAILATGDFVGSREEVLDRLQQDYAMGGWAVVLGESELAGLGFQNFTAATLDSLVLDDARNSTRFLRAFLLVPTQKQRSYPWIFVVLGLVLVAGIGAGIYWWYKVKAAEAQRALMEAQQRLQRERPPPQPAPHVWKDQPLPMEFAQNCEATKQYEVIAGWTLESLTCQGGSATLQFKRGEFGNVMLLRQLLPDAAIDFASGGGNVATLAMPVARPTELRDESLLNAKDLLIQLMGMFQAWEYQIAITEEPPPPPPPPDAAPPPPGTVVYAPPTWKTYKFSSSLGGLRPSVLAARLDLPGLRFNKLEWQNGQWSIEGEIYAN